MEQKISQSYINMEQFQVYGMLIFFLKFLKVKIGPAIINIDPVMEKPFFPAMFHVKNCGALEGHLRMWELAPQSFIYIDVFSKSSMLKVVEFWRTYSKVKSWPLIR